MSIPLACVTTSSHWAVIHCSPPVWPIALSRCAAGRYRFPPSMPVQPSSISQRCYCKKRVPGKRRTSRGRKWFWCRRASEARGPSFSCTATGTAAVSTASTSLAVWTTTAHFTFSNPMTLTASRNRRESAAQVVRRVDAIVQHV